MHITSKSRYALKIMVDLAQLDASTPHTQRSGLAQRQGIPPDYMDHILSRLRESGLIDSIRGRGGGYRLNRGAEKISVWEIFEAVEDGILPVRCLEDGVQCVTTTHCSTKDAWVEITEAIRGSLSAISLLSLAEKPGAAIQPDALGGFGGVQECKAPPKTAGKRN